MGELSDKTKELAENISYHLGLPFVVSEDLENEEIRIDVGIHGLGRKLENLIEKVLYCMEDSVINCDNAYEINRYFSKILTRLLFGKDYENETVYKFIKNVNKLSEMTYENEEIETGIYIAAEEMIEEFCKKNQWNLIKSNENDFEEIVYKNKPMRKLIDNREYAYCFDENLKYIGIISNSDTTQNIREKMNVLQKKDLRKSIIEQVVDICEYFATNIKRLTIQEINKKDMSYEKAEAVMDAIVKMYQPYNIEEMQTEIENILYIEISNGRVKYYLNPYTYIEEIHGEWRLYEYLSLVAPLVGQILNVLFFAYGQEDYAYAVNIIYKLVVVIKEMATKNVGGLIVLCDEDCKINEIVTSDENLNFKRLFGDIRNVELLSLSSEKLIDLISVDGATIINSQMELVDFGRILKNNMQNNSEYGARTNAAISASQYGLAIKISEDGDVTLYRNGRVCRRYEQF